MPEHPYGPRALRVCAADPKWGQRLLPGHTVGSYGPYKVCRSLIPPISLSPLVPLLTSVPFSNPLCPCYPPQRGGPGHRPAAKDRARAKAEKVSANIGKTDLAETETTIVVLQHLQDYRHRAALGTGFGVGLVDQNGLLFQSQSLDALCAGIPRPLHNANTCVR